MNKKHRLEFILFSFFLVCSIGTLFKIPYCPWAVLLSGFVLCGLYFYFGFWLFSDLPISLFNRIMAGLVFSINVCALIFCLLHWPIWEIDAVLGFIGLLIILAICWFNKKNPAYKQLVYRSLVFLVVTAAVYTYRRLHG
jgi:hypothetical protein